MQKPIALILGATGGIGGATRTAFLNAGYRVIPIGRSMLDFNLPTAEPKLIELLNSAQAQVVVNAAGVFANGAGENHHKTFNVNFGSNWSIIRYYHTIKDISAPVKIIMVGSSSYNFGRSQYPLYSASKAALYNLWQSSVDMFADSNISVDLINPMRTQTRMNADHYNPNLPYHSTNEVADQILELTKHAGSSCVNMTLEEAK
jgi:ribitol-5-phosphate 2-dehydrogenase (NADP+) / D-ribitol-5-phosphate cytidylyltransferase